MAQLQSTGITGSLTVTGNITAQEFHTEYVSSSILHESGSTSFGNTSDDVHNFTGSLNVLGPISAVGAGISDFERVHINNLQAWSAQDLGSASSGSISLRINGRLGATNDFIVHSNGTSNYTMQVVGNAETHGQLHINPFGGNVGIGTSAPTKTLDVDGTGIFRNTLTVHRAAGDKKLQFIDDRTGTDTYSIEHDTNQIYFYNESESEVVLGMKNSGDVYIPSGFLGVGTTTPSAPLQIHGEVYSQIKMYSDHTYSLNRNWRLMTNNFGSGNWGGFSIDQSSAQGNSTFTQRFGIALNGNVGIGTDNPGQKLHIHNTATLTATYQKFTNGTATTGTTLGIDADGDFLINNGEAKQIKLYTSDEQRLTILSGGNVGIGSTNPANAKLVINSGTSDGENTVKIVHTRNDSNVPTRALQIDMDLSGTDNTDADRTHYGLHVDVDSSADGDISNEHRIYGIASDVRFTGFSDIVRGAWFHAESNNITENTTQLVGTWGEAMHDSGQTAGGVTNMYGMYGLSSVQDKGEVGSSFGGYFNTNITSTRTVNTGVTKGVQGEITIDANTANLTYGEMIAVMAVIDNNEGTVPNFGDQYLFKGDYQGTRGDNAWGLHVEGDKHYLGSRLFLGTTSPDTTSIFEVRGSDAERFVRFRTSNAEERFIFYIGGTGNAAYLDIADSSGTTQTRFRASGDSYILGGDVGIGTSSPDSKLDVKGPSATPADGNQTLSITNTTGGTQLNIGTAENSYGWIEAREGGTLRNLLLNPNGGLVGIGTTSPGYMLDVLSSAKIGSINTASSTTNYENKLVIAGKNNYSDGTTWYGNYGQILLSSTTNMTGSARQFLITNALDNNKFAIIRSVDAETSPVTNSTGTGVNSGTADFVINNTGNVGIGTTSPAGKLEISQQLSATSTIDYPVVITSRDDGNSLNQQGGEGVGIKFRLAGNSSNTPGDSLVGASIAAIRETATDTDSSTGLGFFISQNNETLDEAVRIDHNGSVGIGDTNPQAKLHVKSSESGAGAAWTNADDLIIENSGNAGLAFQTPNTGAATIAFQDPESVQAGFIQYLHDDNALRFATNGNNIRMLINSSGNVGIGVTPFAHTLGTSATLDLKGNGGIWGYAGATYVNSNAYYDGGWKYKSANPAAVLQVGGSSQHLSFRQAASGTADGAITYTQPFMINSSGYVGISTTNPQGSLHVYSGTSERLLVGGDVSIKGATDLQIDGTSRRVSFNAGTGTVRTSTSNSLYLATNSTTALTINANQDATFAEDLTVDGEFTFNGGNVQGNVAYTVDMSNTSTFAENTYYPVTIPLQVGRETELRIEVPLNSGDDPSYATHSSGVSLYLKWTAIGNGWGTNYGHRTIHEWDERYSSVTLVGGITQMNNGSVEVVYLRGGTTYFFRANRAGLSITPRSSTYTNNSQSVSPTTSIVNDPMLTGIGKVGLNRLVAKNVGIGTSAPTALLHLYQSIGDPMLHIQAESAGDPGITFTSIDNRTGNIFYSDGTTNAKLTYDHADTSFKLYAHNTTVADFVLNETTAYFPSQNVGIGTTSPAALLDVSNRVYIDTYSSEASGNNSVISGYLKIIAGGKTGWGVDDQLGKLEFYGADGSGAGARTAASILAVCETGNGTSTTTFSSGLAFYTSPYNAAQVERIRISRDGKVGIGTTTPAVPLHVNGANVSIGTIGTPKSDWYTTSYNSLQIGEGTTLWGRAGDSHFSGNYYVNTGGSGGAAQDTYINALSAHDFWLDNSSGSLKYRNAGLGGAGNAISWNTRFVVLNNGNFGIGTTSPATTLHVLGTVKFDSYSTADPDSTSIAAYPAAQTFTHYGEANGVCILGGKGSYNGTGLIIGEETGRSSNFKFIKAVSDTNGTNLAEEFWVNGVGDAYFAGNVGIGDTSPGQKLEVAGNIKLSDGGQRNIYGPTNQSLGIFANPNGASEGIYFSTDNGTTTEMVLINGGNVGIGTTSPGATLTVHGQQKWYTTNADGNELRGFFNPGGSGDGATFSLYQNNGTTVGVELSANGDSWFKGDVIAYYSSDRRLKDNLVKINNPLAKINKLSGYRFNWNDKQNTYEKGSKDIGIVAQEIEEVLPEIVQTRENGYKAVNYQKIVALLIEGMKEQQETIDKLEDRIKKLENR